jgi:hypothetical protein
VGSADVERGFSIMNHIRYDRRSQLSVKHIEDISRLRINGPDIENFNVKPYTLHWLKHHMQTDAETFIKKSSNLGIKKREGSNLF